MWPGISCAYKADGSEAMHFNLGRAAGIITPVLLGSMLVAGAAALPAKAQTWQDTALAGGAVQAAAFSGAKLPAADGGGVIKLSGARGVWSPHGTRPLGGAPSRPTNSHSGGGGTHPR